jgi:hypothetical protein
MIGFEVEGKLLCQFVGHSTRTITDGHHVTSVHIIRAVVNLGHSKLALLCCYESFIPKYLFKGYPARAQLSL